jgi:hypothetical protein
MIMYQSIIANIIARVGVFISVGKVNPSRFHRIFSQCIRIKRSRNLIFDVMQIFEEVTTKSMDQGWIHSQRRNNFTTATITSQPGSCTVKAKSDV